MQTKVPTRTKQSVPLHEQKLCSNTVLGTQDSSAMVEFGDYRYMRNPHGQLKSDSMPDNRSAIQRKAANINNTGLPNQLKAGIESLSGMSMDTVKVHYNSSKPAHLNALAYAQGRDIHLASGQEKHLPHEAWHVVQQRQGRVKANANVHEVALNNDANLEREADVMGAKSASFTQNHVSSNTISGGVSTQVHPPSDIVQRVLSLDSVEYESNTDVDQLYKDIQTELDVPVPYSSEHFFRSLRLREVWKKRPVQVQQVLHSWIEAPNPAPKAERKRGSALALKREYANLIDLATAVVGEVDAAPQIEKEKIEAGTILDSEAVKNDLVDFVNINLTPYLKTTQPNGLGRSLMDLVEEKGKGDYLPHMVNTTTIDKVIDAPDKFSIGMLIAAIHDVTNIIYGSGISAVKDILTIPDELLAGSVADVDDEHFFSIKRKPYLMKDWRGKSATPMVSSKPVQTAYVLNTPVSMGPSNTTGRLMMLAAASGASKNFKESLAWGLFAFWYHVYRRELTDIHQQHFVLDMAANFGVDYNPLQPELPERLLPILDRAQLHAKRGGTFFQLTPIDQKYLTIKVRELLKSHEISEENLSKIEKESATLLFNPVQSKLVAAALNQGWTQSDLYDELLHWVDYI